MFVSSIIWLKLGKPFSELASSVCCWNFTGIVRHIGSKDILKSLEHWNFGLDRYWINFFIKQCAWGYTWGAVGCSGRITYSKSIGFKSFQDNILENRIQTQKYFSLLSFISYSSSFVVLFAFYKARFHPNVPRVFSCYYFVSWYKF